MGVWRLWYCFRMKAAVIVAIVLAGGAIGVVRNPTLPAVAALTFVPFAGFHMLLGLGIRDVVARLLSRRRMREITALLFVAFVTLPRLLLSPRSGRGRAAFQSFLQSQSESGAPWWPWTASA